MKFIMTVVAVFVSSAISQEVEYVFNGIGSGSIGGVSFFETEFSITLSGDESDIFQTSQGFDMFVDSDAFFSISGIADMVLFTTDISLVMNDEANFLVLGSPASGRSLAIMNNEELMGYDLRGEFGPITDYELKGTNTFVHVPTDFGFLSFAEMSELTYYAVPAPSALFAIILGVGSMSCRRDRAH